MRRNVPPLPTDQQRYDGAPELDPHVVQERRERVFLVLAGLFLGTLAMLNILGTSRFLDLSFTVPGTDWTIPAPLAVGVLPYPVTFLCTDIISELWGRRRASGVVLMGLALNLWVIFIMWLGGVLPGVRDEGQGVFFEIRTLAFANVTASMVAYLAAQLVDVQLFHFWRKLTKGRHLWLRNNGSTLVSQLVDTAAVTLVIHYVASALPLAEDEPLLPQLVVFVGASYTFKLLVALADTLPFYLGVRWLARYMRMPPVEGYGRAAASGEQPAADA